MSMDEAIYRIIAKIGNDVDRKAVDISKHMMHYKVFRNATPAEIHYAWLEIWYNIG